MSHSTSVSDNAAMAVELPRAATSACVNSIKWHR
jgi:hypothetical protein